MDAQPRGWDGARDGAQLARELLHRLLQDCNGAVLSGRTDHTKFRTQVVVPLLETGPLEMTIQDKRRSSRQQYRITEAGRAALAIAKNT